MSYVGGCWPISVAWDVVVLALAGGCGGHVPEVQRVRAACLRLVEAARLEYGWVQIRVVGLVCGQALHLRVWGCLQWLLGEGV